MLCYDSRIRILIETKPNEPIDRSVCPTMGHAMAISAATAGPSRVGGLLESAHAMLARGWILQAKSGLPLRWEGSGVYI